MKRMVDGEDGWWSAWLVERMVGGEDGWWRECLAENGW